MNKEECLKALERLSNPPFDSTCGGCGGDCEDCVDMNAVWKLEELINEHFELKEIIKKHGLENLTNHELDCAIKSMLEHVKKVNELSEELLILKSNPPFKFEDLRNGMPMWDNKEERWVITQFVEDSDIKCHMILIYYDDKWDGIGQEWFDFEENRYFRHEVKEVE